MVRQQGAGHATGGDMDSARSNPSTKLARSDLEQVVRAVMRHDFHEPSRTHIVWCPGVGRNGAKGFGDAADEAHRMFLRRIGELLDAASPTDLQRWSANLARSKAESSREAQIRSLAARERMGAYSLGLDPAQVTLLADAPGVPASNQAIVDALRAGLAAFRAAADRTTRDDVVAAISANESKLRVGRQGRGDETIYRTVRMDAETHARLQLQAHEIGVKLQELCRYVLALALESRAPTQNQDDGATAFNAKPRGNPFVDLSTQQFAQVAKDARMSRTVLSAIRDGRVVGLPGVVAERIGRAMPTPVPANDIILHACSGARLPPAMAAKAKRKPTAFASAMTLEEVAREAGMTADAIQHMLAD
ncbi:hypothetical protein E0493_20040 [Roseomonas sp. M0104]|uniref:Uncharacterized protein n=1 Tax=Teichococcus coralli TaxID=2545983 RepID=A0A845BHV3_9PROT|nr:hypothetical protein [Pseudoroseomonas coralli]MXP65644.1 hypothetical protein [Pseudoroseomonas coralli]